MIPNYLTDLQLPQVFSAYCNYIDPYIFGATGNKHIVDSESQKISGFVSPAFGQVEDAAQKYFSVENQSSCPYALIQVDNAIIQSSTTQKCDCIVANHRCLCFIEFKANAISGKITAIEKNYKKAIAQIEATMNLFIAHFTAQGIDFRTLRSVEAFICFRHGYPKYTSSQMNYRVAFASANGGIPLSFSRKKIL